MREHLQGLARRFRDEIGVYRAVMADPRCPRVARWTLGGAMAYALSPIDLIPDFIPVLGYLDDLIIPPIMVWLAIRMIPEKLIAEHREQRRQLAGCPTSKGR